jgi:hypothetical protein
VVAGSILDGTGNLISQLRLSPLVGGNFCHSLAYSAVLTLELEETADPN